jgi:ribonuclease P protein component
MQTFKKEERLCSKTTLKELVDNGKSITNNPLKLLWLKNTELNTSFPAQLAISVSKRHFKHAVARNKIKRRIREAYRKNKHIIYGPLDNKKEKIALLIIYLANKEFTYSEIEQKVILILQKFNKANE